jgi:zinc/manganese transport system ATP-binding protein
MTVTLTPSPVAALEDAEARVAGRTVWSGVDLAVGAGEFVAVLGPNGSGKTTLLKVLLGELPLSAGRATLLGGQPGSANRRIGYLPQRRHFDAGVRIRGIDLVRLGLDGTRWGLPLRRSGAERVKGVIDLVGAGEYARRPIGQLSGGEQQRLLIAQALVSDPSVLILDEPLDSLDLPNQTAVAALLGRICRERGVTVILVAHDVNPLLPYLDRVVYFGGGHAAVGTPRQVITAETLSNLYGVLIDVLETSDGRLVVVGLPEAPAHHSDRHEHG